MKTGKIQAKAAVVLALILIIVGIIVTGIAKETSMPKLSKERMKENFEQAEKAKEETEVTGEKTEADERYAKNLESFQISAAEAAVNGAVKEDQISETEEMKETEGKKESEEEGEYLCRYTSERLVTEEDVEKLNSKTYENLPQGKGIIQMVVNEMYARYGYQFQNEEIQSYFDQKEWYQKITVRSADMDDVIKSMTETERENVEFLSEYIVEE